MAGDMEYVYIFCKLVQEDMEEGQRQWDWASQAGHIVIAQSKPFHIVLIE